MEFAKRTNVTPRWMRSGQRGIVIMHMVQTVLYSSIQRVHAHNTVQIERHQNYRTMRRILEYMRMML